MTGEFDVIIVGADSAGRVLATRLSEDPKRRVLPLEAGGEDDDPRVSTPATIGALPDTLFDWRVRTAPQEHLSRRQIGYPRGRGPVFPVWRFLPVCADAIEGVRGAPFAGKDILCGFGPLEGLRGLVALREVVVDGSLQVIDAGVTAAPDGRARPPHDLEGAVPCAVASTISARQTSFRAVLRSEIGACSSARTARPG